MTLPQILALVALPPVVAALVHVLRSPERVGSAMLAGVLGAGFALYTGLTIAREGLWPLWFNQTANLWGVQVWWDLLISLTLALAFIAPRARAVGMRLPGWLLLVVASGSIGLLAMAARLFWLERRVLPAG